MKARNIELAGLALAIFALAGARLPDSIHDAMAGWLVATATMMFAIWPVAHRTAPVAAAIAASGAAMFGGLGLAAAARGLYRSALLCGAVALVSGGAAALLARQP